MKVTEQQQKSFEKLRAVCPETKMVETRTIGYLDVLTCDNFAPANDKRVDILEDGKFIFWTTYENHFITQII